jgi:hypothetical protein
VPPGRTFLLSEMVSTILAGFVKERVAANNPGESAKCTLSFIWHILDASLQPKHHPSSNISLFLTLHFEYHCRGQPCRSAQIAFSSYNNSLCMSCFARSALLMCTLFHDHWLTRPPPGKSSDNKPALPPCTRTTSNLSMLPA